MKKSFFLKQTAAIGAIALVLTGCLNKEGQGNQTTNKTTIIRGPEIILTASTSRQELAQGVTLPVWTFNNSVPGPEIRVKQGDRVKVDLKNELPEPVTIHWHGVPVPNAMDGIPGVTQNAVQPGDSFTYEFIADVPGTYWYHSHQNSVNQLDRGLYGAFVVEPKNEAKPDRDYTLILDEWAGSGMDMAGMDHNQMDDGDMDNEGMNHSNMNHGSMNMEPGDHSDGDHMSMYDLFTINGKSGSLADKLSVKQGDKVRIRLINAGYMSHRIHLHGHEFQIIATDGQPVRSPGVLRDSLLSIAPGERYDIEFTANHPGQWLLESHDDNKASKEMKAVIAYEGTSEVADKPNGKTQFPIVDMSRYGEAGQSVFALNQEYSREYTMDLNTKTNDGQTVYTINGKTFPDIEPMNVRKGDTVKVRLINRSRKDDHPMHLHGHFFQVLSRNGKPFEGAPIVKDTLNLKPGEEYEVAFQADNEGNWMFHCHDLHHASAGMVTELKYADYQTDFVSDPKAGNMPE